MTTSNIGNQLKNLGLNSYEVKIWTALLSRGVSTVGELSDIANVPRSRSYDVLESLEKKGFVIIKTRKPIRYYAVPPQEAIKNTKKKTIKNTKGKIKSLNDLRNKNTLKKLTTLHSQGTMLIGPAELSGVLRGRYNLYNHVEYMLKKAEKNVLISTTQKEMVVLVEKFEKIFKKLKNKNVHIKILTQTPNKTNNNTEKARQFAEIKHTNNKTRFCIVDGKEIIFMVLDDTEVHPTYDIGIWANTPFAKDLERFV